MVTTQACSTCGGRGRVIDVVCDNCRGSGRISEVQARRLQVPEGIESGMRLRVSGGDAGDPGAPGRPVREDKRQKTRLMRDGEDLIHRMRISFVDAALGAEVDVPTLEGTKQVRVDPVPSRVRR